MYGLGRAVLRNVGAHKRVLQLADTLSMPKVHHNKDAVRPILRACFSFLAAFVHKHKANQVEVWADRHIIEANLGYDVEAETALAEVRTICCREVLWVSSGG